jgi:IclR family transcriptional regulator, KDG regulon repressor
MNSNNMKSMNKVFNVLETFLSIESEELRLSEIVKQTGYNKSTVNRIVTTLVDRGYLTHKEKWGKYSLGTKFLSYSNKFKNKLKIRGVAMPSLANLKRLVRESVILATCEGDKAVYSEIMDSVYPLRMTPEVSDPVPLYCTGIGKIFLAHRREQDLDEYLNAIELVPWTENTITDINILKTQLKKVAKENIAIDDEEWIIGVRNITSGILNSDGHIIACVGVTGPSVRLTPLIVKKVTPLVIKCAQDISFALGYDSSIARRNILLPIKKGA